MATVDVNYIKVTWTEPIPKDGSKIRTYILKKRNLDDDTQWIEALNVPLDCLQVTVMELEEGKVYEFREVLSLAGHRLFSDVSKPQKAKPPYGKI